MSKRLQSGFSTLEVIAAVAIIAVALVPIMALQTQLARNQVRLASVHADSTAVHNAMALLRDINPMLTPSGERRLDDQTVVRWVSRPLSEATPSTNPAGFEVRLYAINAEIRRDGAPAVDLAFDLVGWRSAATEME